MYMSSSKRCKTICQSGDAQSCIDLPRFPVPLIEWLWQDMQDGSFISASARHRDLHITFKDILNCLSVDRGEAAMRRWFISNKAVICVWRRDEYDPSRLPRNWRYRHYNNIFSMPAYVTHLHTHGLEEQSQPPPSHLKSFTMTHCERADRHICLPPTVAELHLQTSHNQTMDNFGQRIRILHRFSLSVALHTLSVNVGLTLPEIAILPRALRRLKLKRIDCSAQDTMAIAWPPHLTHLAIDIWIVGDDCTIKGLPQSVTHLRIDTVRVDDHFLYASHRIRLYASPDSVRIDKVCWPVHLRQLSLWSNASLRSVCLPSTLTHLALSSTTRFDAPLCASLTHLNFDRHSDRFDILSVISPCNNLLVLGLPQRVLKWLQTSQLNALCMQSLLHMRIGTRVVPVSRTADGKLDALALLWHLVHSKMMSTTTTS